jgi:hypothetical protein
MIMGGVIVRSTVDIKILNLRTRFPVRIVGCLQVYDASNDLSKNFLWVGLNFSKVFSVTLV